MSGAQYPTSKLAVTIMVAAAVGVSALTDVRVAAEEDDGSQGLLQRVLAQTSRAGVALHATRELRAGTVSGKHQGWMIVETMMTSSGTFSWNVLDEGGSERTRQKVFYELLRNEAEAHRGGARDDAALTLANYQFAPAQATRSGQLQIRLTPRRHDPQLIDGVLIVSADGYPIRLEGRLAKSPSFWVKSVTVVKQYGRFGGIALPTSIESLADLKMFGRASFTMRYRYSEVNGRSVSHAVASAPLVGPSAEILALHGPGSD